MKKKLLISACSALVLASSMAFAAEKQYKFEKDRDMTIQEYGLEVSFWPKCDDPVFIFYEKYNQALADKLKLILLEYEDGWIVKLKDDGQPQKDIRLTNSGPNKGLISAPVILNVDKNFNEKNAQTIKTQVKVTKDKSKLVITRSLRPNDIKCRFDRFYKLNQ
ncbi:MAG: hypothetical protein COB66_05405 [Coxiella sp. (in: Bacteria)]|nr:MAG: hypothetical protein COB66_05405 [Coxiella sp. (in: g-proteobacteria)]